MGLFKKYVNQTRKPEQILFLCSQGSEKCSETAGAGAVLRSQGNRMDTFYHEWSADSRYRCNCRLGWLSKWIYILAVLLEICTDLNDL